MARTAVYLLCVLLVVGSMLTARSLARGGAGATGPMGWDQWTIRLPEEAGGDPDLREGLRRMFERAGHDHGLSFVSWAQTTVAAGPRTVGCRIVATGAEYPDYVPVPLLRGAFFTKRHEAAGDPVIVLSEGLSRELFGDVEVLGIHVDLPGRTYRVVGVTAAPNWLGGMAGQDAAAYVPFSSAATWAERLRFGVVRGSQEGSRTPFDLLRAVGADPERYAITDHRETARLLEQAGRFPTMVAGLLTAAILVLLAARDVVRRELETRYLSQALRARGPALGARVAGLLVVAAAAVAVVRLTVFLPYVPPRFLPTSLADTALYRQLVAAAFRSWIVGLDAADVSPEGYIELCRVLAGRLSGVTLAAGLGAIALCRRAWRASPAALLLSVLVSAGLLGLMGLEVAPDPESVSAATLFVASTAAQGAAAGRWRRSAAP